ncbi:hypothetical protein THAOC_15914 [Thalassiosira oceanica]|uniref:Uncharacterized protein n=1 Tax=Thalassiosira oceanica TaxID=159749 RepID=K0SEK2_THAOC|nr:hypothetical protein THAOC_15914 [Thalassiosira oceanica]|eukprot:EJK63424.1 hypothetical protein THAOC_15914 [Thalassiosira oceanica]
MFDPYPGCGLRLAVAGGVNRSQLFGAGRAGVAATWRRPQGPPFLFLEADRRWDRTAHQDRTSPQPSTATALAATRRSSDRRASGASDSLARCSLSVPFSNFASNLLVSHQYWTSPQPTSSCPGLPRYASSLLFQAGDGIVRRSPGGAPVPGNEREAGSPADRAAPRPRSLRLPTPCSEVKILKMDGDGAPSQPPSDCVEGDTSASCAVRTAASRRPRGRPRRDSQNGRGNATSSAGARRSIRSRTRSADSSTSRSTVGCSGGSGSIGGSGEGSRRSPSRRRASARPGNISNDGDQGPFPSQRSRLTDRTSMDEDIEINQLLGHVTQGGSQTPRASQDGKCITFVSTNTSPSQRSRLTDRTSMDEDIEINQLLWHVTQGGSQTPRATQDGSQTHHAGDEAQLWELSMAFEFAPSRGYIHFHSIH